MSETTSTPATTSPVYQNYVLYRKSAYGWQPAGYVVTSLKLIRASDYPISDPTLALGLDPDNKYPVDSIYTPGLAQS